MNSIVRHVAEILGIKTNEELEDLYRFAHFLAAAVVGISFVLNAGGFQENCLVL